MYKVQSPSTLSLFQLKELPRVSASCDALAAPQMLLYRAGNEKKKLNQEEVGVVKVSY